MCAHRFAQYAQGWSVYAETSQGVLCDNGAMNERLVSYLKDNRDQILENWITEADLPLPESTPTTNGCHGTVPLAFLESTFDRILGRLSGHACNCPKEENGPEMHLDDILNVTCACKSQRFGGRVCMELHDSGLRAFMSVLNDTWDTEGEFSKLDRECSADLINHALAWNFGQEVTNCQHKLERKDCPFV